MNVPGSLQTQRGATLVVGLIMLVLITLMVTAAFMLSTSNLRAVGNMQFRNEAAAAANDAVELVLSSPFTNAPTAQQIDVDIDNNGVSDYRVDVAAPTCIRASVAAAAAASSLSLGTAMSTSAYWNTVWDIQATATDLHGSGAAVVVRQGVRVLLSDSQKSLVCS